MMIEPAHVTDLEQVLSVLNTSADMLRERGIIQWQNGFVAAEIAPHVARGEMWIVREAGKPVATMRADGEADPGVWAPEESKDLAMYVSNLATTPSAPAGTSEMLLRWITDHAACLGYRWVRLVAWPIIPELQQGCCDRGWTYLRTVEQPHRRPAVLLQRLALPDPEARLWVPAPAPAPALGSRTAGFEIADDGIFGVSDLG